MKPVHVVVLWVLVIRRCRKENPPVSYPSILSIGVVAKLIVS